MIQPQLLHIFILNQWPSVRALYQTEPPLFCTQCFYWGLCEVSCSGKPLNVSLGWLESFWIISFNCELESFIYCVKTHNSKLNKSQRSFLTFFLSFKSYLWQFSNKTSATCFFKRMVACQKWGLASRALLDRIWLNLQLASPAQGRRVVSGTCMFCF